MLLFRVAWLMVAVVVRLFSRPADMLRTLGEAAPRSVLIVAGADRELVRGLLEAVLPRLPSAAVSVVSHERLETPEGVRLERVQTLARLWRRSLWRKWPGAVIVLVGPHTSRRAKTYGLLIRARLKFACAGLGNAQVVGWSWRLTLARGLLCAQRCLLFLTDNTLGRVLRLRPALRAPQKHPYRSFDAIIPTFNGRHLLGPCIEALQAAEAQFGRLRG
jgi:hypothetical protein